jgi:hypothetical protein
VLRNIQPSVRLISAQALALAEISRVLGINFNNILGFGPYVSSPRRFIFFLKIGEKAVCAGAQLPVCTHWNLPCARRGGLDISMELNTFSDTECNWSVVVQLGVEKHLKQMFRIELRAILKEYPNIGRIKIPRFVALFRGLELPPY